MNEEMKLYMYDISSDDKFASGVVQAREEAEAKSIVFSRFNLIFESNRLEIRIKEVDMHEKVNILMI